MIFYPEFYIEFPEPGIVELLTVVGDEYSKNPKLEHNQFPGEVPNVFLSDFG